MARTRDPEGATPAAQAKRVLDAMKKDVDELAYDYLESSADRSSYSTFALHFKRKEMGTIFVGRLSRSELVEFTENLFAYIASLIYDPESALVSIGYLEVNSPLRNENANKGFELAESIVSKKIFRGRQLKLFAIFLLFTLYKLQPKQHMALIRLSVPQLRDINKLIEEVLLPEGEVQAYYCLRFLAKSRAFNVTPFEREFNPLAPHRIDVSQMSDGYQVAPRMDALQEQLNDLLPQHDDYLKAMASVGVDSNAGDPVTQTQTQTQPLSPAS